jgi:hypothetical protein
MINELKIGEISSPRFEFRTFGSDFEDVAQRMSRLSSPVPQKFQKRTSEEIYIVSTANSTFNTKIRDGKLDIKKLIRVLDGLEQWSPMMKGEFPMKAETLETEVFPLLQVEIPKPGKDEFPIDEFLSIIKNNPGLQAINVEKERYGYTVNDTICEYARVWIDGKLIYSLSSESSIFGDVIKTIKDLGLEGVENINYLQAVKRVIGMEAKPLAK